jgi:arylsulfatase A-like enzyme
VRAPSRRLEPIWIGSLDITDNTIVTFVSDNGAETFGWAAGGNHLFRGE